MEPSDDLSLSRPSPRRELQGPRPTPLKVRKDSHRIKKPPPQSRPPVIIYTVSPKVIHANRSEFMSLVQRLTGPAAAPSSSASAAPAAGGAPRLAALEKTPLPAAPGGDHVLHQLGIDDVVSSGRATGFFPPGILSPVPSSLPSVSPELFVSGATTAAAVQHPLNFFNELSPSFNGNKSGGGYVENPAFLPFSPSYNNNLIANPTLSSPGACWDLFNQNHDF